MKSRGKMNQNGFSLVELIVVISIMVILVGVLAPVYVRYVESTRKATDVEALSSIANAMEIILVDHAAREEMGITIKAQFDADGEVTFESTDSNVAAGEMAVTIGSYTLRGSWSPMDGVLEASSDASGAVTFTPDSAKVVHQMGIYSENLGRKIGVIP